MSFPRDLAAPLASSYDPKAVEAGWMEWWEAEGFFCPKDGGTGERFVMVMPPPNVTGSLHLGHTLTNAIQDTLTRWHRMKGDQTLWVPGTDHAGIATQSVVERHLAKVENITRHDLGREKFLGRVWAWKAKYGDHICQQLRRLGISADWSREAFTLSPALSKAVVEAFVRLFDRGLIYRDTRLVSWCPHLRTALSDIEVNVEDVEKPMRTNVPGYAKTVEVGMLWNFKYAVKGNSHDDFIQVATTRLETMLGDVAVAVNPKDTRYTHLVGRKLQHPFFPERDIPVIADEHVDVEFGTGAVKITPAHDKNDYEIGRRHKLPAISVFTLDGRIAENGGDFAGMHRFDARVAIEKKLEELGLMVGKEPNSKKMQLPRCSRSNDIVEQMLLPQWWMGCKSAAARAVDAVKTGELRLHPAHYDRIWFHFLENIRDWCISRQLWWGHRIPAYRLMFDKPTATEELWVAASSKEEALRKAQSKTPDGSILVDVEQDEDVLDTWFSSGLFPFSVMGWPEQTEDLKAFFPNSLLETGHDIIFFWVARMVMMSYLLTDQLPFRDVLLHAMMRDAHGKKMSKTLGNVVDPLEVIEGITLDNMHQKLQEGNLPEKEIARAKDAQKKDFPKGIPECGADALRYGLLAYTSQGRSINLDINRVVGYRFFCNKLWNATRFALSYLPAPFVPSNLSGQAGSLACSLAWEDKWILHRLSQATVKTNAAFEAFDFSAAVQATYGFFLYDFCDIYLELLKPRFASNATDEAAQQTLYTCLETALKLLSPMLPFVTEELYQRLPAASWKTKSISIAPYPQRNPAWDSAQSELEADFLMSVVKQFRSLIVQLGVDPKLRLKGFIVAAEGAPGRTFLEQVAAPLTATLAKLATCEIVTVSPPAAVSDVINNSLAVAVDPEGQVDYAAVVEKLSKRVAATMKTLESNRKKMSSPDYETKVPPEVRVVTSEKVNALELELKAALHALESVKKVM